jgi:hypothetical protein
MLLTTHFCALIWVYLGINQKESWLEKGDQYAYKDTGELYILGFYWTFETFTTVGYGDYAPLTTESFIFVIFLEFISLSFFSILMNKIVNIYKRYSNRHATLGFKSEEVDFWLYRISSSKPNSSLPNNLYQKIKTYVSESYENDFSIMNTEEGFYQ